MLTVTYADCHIYKPLMLSVVMPNVIMPNVIMLNVIMLSVIMLSVMAPLRVGANIDAASVKMLRA